MNYNAKRLANYIVNYSINVQPNENVFINFVGYDNILLDYLVEAIKEKNATPIMYCLTPYEEVELIKNINIDFAKKLADYNLNLLSQCKSYISLLEDSDIKIDPIYSEQYSIYRREYKKVLRDYRLQHCKWIGLRLPSKMLATQFGMTYNDFEKYYYDVCGLDYNKMRNDYLWLKDLLSETKHIEIIRDDTRLSFDKDSIPAQILCGEKNLPDGEIYTSPIKKSVNGIISFNTVSRQCDFDFNNIVLEFKDGKVIDFDCNNKELFNKIISVDSGSRYIGEFAIGINSKITESHGVILYDEKILGSIHCALGQAYHNAYNGNDSSLHWDIVQIQKENYGGGQLIFDGEVVMDNGIIKKRKKDN